LLTISLFLFIASCHICNSGGSSCITSSFLICVARTTVGAITTSPLLWASTKTEANVVQDFPPTLGRPFW